jgi:predicted acyltransferase
MFVAGAACAVAGWSWGYWFPINKALWTSSYVLFAAGLALELLAVCYWLVDLKGYRRWALPFVVFGTNALALYFLAELCANLIGVVGFARGDGKWAPLQTILYESLFASWAAPKNASLAYALCTLLFWLGVLTLLYRRRVFIKV